MWTDVQALQERKCWKEISRPENTNILHTMFVLRRKRNEKRGQEKYEAWLVVRGNEERDDDNACVSLCVDFTMITLLLHMAVQNDWDMKQFDLQNALASTKLDLFVYAELSRQLFEDDKNETVGT